jgi:alpha-amylase
MVEGAKHILGWKSPHYVYSCAVDNRISVLMRDYKLSDDICLRFSDSNWVEHPLMADKYIDWIANMPQGEEVINIGMELCAIGMFQPLSSNILDFIKALPVCAAQRGIGFATPAEIVDQYQPVDTMEVPYPMSWNDEERDISGWLGNTMQREAFAKLYEDKLVGRILACKDRRIKQDWDRLQATNNFQYMTTKPQAVPMLRSFYDSAFDAFTNYMNILGDFLKRVNDLFSENVENDELNALYTQIVNLGDELTVKENEISVLRARLEKFEGKVEKTEAPVAEAPAPQKCAAKKTTATKAATTKKAPAKKAAEKK